MKFHKTNTRRVMKLKIQENKNLNEQNVAGKNYCQEEKKSGILKTYVSIYVQSCKKINIQVKKK